MIVELPDCTTSEISLKINELHEERGEAAQTRVLTLLISTGEKELENALETANAASREHPCRVIVIVPSSSRTPVLNDDGSCHPLDAEVRFGADAGAGECIVLRPHGGLNDHLDTLVMPLLVPDAPIVAWWPTNPPLNPAADPLGRMATARVTDALRSDSPAATFAELRENRMPEDTDMSWTRLTVWRGLVASMLDRPPYTPVRSATVTAGPNYLPAYLLAAWMALFLHVPVTLETDPDGEVVTGVRLVRDDGEITLERPHEDKCIITLPGQKPQIMSVPRRTLEDCLSEELRRLDPDEIYAEVVDKGWDLVQRP